MSNLVLGFAGSIGSGKSTLSTSLANLLNWKRVSFGDYVRAVAKERQLSNDREVLQSLGEELICQLGWRRFCQNVLLSASWNVRQPLLVDGIRHVEAIEALKAIVLPSEFRLVYTSVNLEDQLIRLEERGIGFSDKMTNWKQHSTELQVESLLPSYADLVLAADIGEEGSLLKLMTWLQCMEYI